VQKISRFRRGEKGSRRGVDGGPAMVETRTSSMPREPRAVTAKLERARRAIVPLEDSAGEWLNGRELRALLEMLAAGFGILGVDLCTRGDFPQHIADVLSLCRQNRLAPSLLTDEAGLQAAFSFGPDWSAFESVTLAPARAPEEWNGKLPPKTTFRLLLDAGLDAKTRQAWIDRATAASIPWSSDAETDPAVDRLVASIFEEKSGGARLHRLGRIRHDTDRISRELPPIAERFLYFLEMRTRTPRIVVGVFLGLGYRLASLLRSRRKSYAAQAAAPAESVPPPPMDLVVAARDVAANLAAATEIKSSAYGAWLAPFDKMNGSIRWWTAFHERLVLSTVLHLVSPPFTVSVRFAGDADYIGFSFASNAQVMCPMTAESHRLVLHVGASGDYVLLKDGKPETPVHIAGKIFRAGRVPPGIELRLASYGYRLSVITQEVLLWERFGEDASPAAEPVDLSVVVVCTKYSRRLSLLVRSIAQQRDFDLKKAELLVAHVPGLDGTEDLLDCASLAWPELRIVPVRFPSDQQTSKGLMINLSVARASGRRILVTDADILLPPDIFHRLETEFRDDRCVAVAGRKMLDKKTTADLLLGLRDPVRDFQELASGPGELRILEAKGIPIGFFQCVMRADFGEVNYDEFPHFEGADHSFAAKMGARFGGWTIVRDAVVLHLDHSGSRWFGTDRQM